MSSAAILRSHRDGVVGRAKGLASILAIQDTTELDFTSHPATTGLGFINQSHQQGFRVHSYFAVSGTGEPLGLLDQYCWNCRQRKGKREQRRQQPIQKKESHRWLQSAAAAEVDLVGQAQLIHVGDREADIFELFAQARREQVELLIRVQHKLQLARNPQRPARTARLRLRAMSVTIGSPSPRRHHSSAFTATPECPIGRRM